MLGFGIPNTVSVEKAFQNVSQLFGMIENFFIRLLISGQFFVCILSFRILLMCFEFPKYIVIYKGGKMNFL